MLAAVGSASSGFGVVPQGVQRGAQVQAMLSALPGAAALSREDQQRVDKLERTDREVRQHEQAHMAVGADLVTSGPSYTYEKGPDGKRYAVAGEVGIDTSKADTPEKTVDKAQHIRATALAPAEPSSQDFRVAALASKMELAALQEISRQGQEALQQQEAVSREEAVSAYQAVSSYGAAAPAPGVSAYA